MQDWLRDFGGLVVTWMGIQVVLMCVLGMWAGWHGWQVRLGHRIVQLADSTRSAPVVPLRRPIEQLAADVRRLRAAFGQEGLRFAKWEGTRQAYDAVLAEAAGAFEIEHLLDLLPPGVERDAERQRVVGLLEQAGLLTAADAA